MPADHGSSVDSTADRLQSQRGFTLVELLVCLAILALVTAFLPMPFTAHSGASLNRVANDLATAMRETRAHAIGAGRTETFAIDLATDTYLDAGGQSHRLPAGVRSSGPNAAIRFFPDGSATGGSIALSQDGKTFEILVDWLTGRIAVASGSAAPGSIGASR